MAEQQVIASLVLILISAMGTCFMFFILRCRHFWELVDKTEFEPPIKIYAEVGASRLHLGYLDESQMHQMSKRTVVIVLRCTKCGKAMIEKVSA